MAFNLVGEKLLNCFAVKGLDLMPEDLGNYLPP
jgi:hypothetical protein